MPLSPKYILHHKDYYLSICVKKKKIIIKYPNQICMCIYIYVCMCMYFHVMMHGILLNVAQYHRGVGRVGFLWIVLGKEHLYEAFLQELSTLLFSCFEQYEQC